jgi:protein involved in polysaccharide export with SLBB domain
MATIGDPTTLAAGQSVQNTLTASPTTLALLAGATAGDPTASLTVEIYNALGVLVAGSVSTPGSALAMLAAPSAGTYTVKVKNVGAGGLTQTPTLVVREPWVP